MMHQRLAEFAELEEFLRHYAPLTPTGKKAKQALTLSPSRMKLEHDYDLTELAIAFIKRSPTAASRAEYHLKRMPLLDCLDQSLLDTSEIFLVKKLLINYRGVCEILPPDIARATDCSFHSSELLDLLCAGLRDGETFFLSDAYSPRLAQIRARIREVEGQLAVIRGARLGEILDRCGLDFRFRDFILVPDVRTEELDRDLVFVESFDAHRLVVRPVLPDTVLSLLREKGNLLEEERCWESKVLEEISTEIAREREALAGYVGALARLDTILAQARLSMAFEMTRPRILEWGSGIEIQGGRFLPQVERCREQELPYTEVNARFDQRLIVIHGSNMGGKTVLLKSLTFFQMLAQCGFFVPCRAFSTVPFEQIHCLGSMMGEKAGGLSSFGLEVHTLSQAQAKEHQRALYIMDEFARNTNSREARALISAILHHFNGRGESYAFLATHYMGLPSFAHVGYVRMRGLNHQRYEEYHAATADQDILERIRLISQFMEYEVEENPTQGKVHDGLRVAEILGLDKDIIETAAAFLGGMDEE